MKEVHKNPGLGDLLYEMRGDAGSDDMVWVLPERSINVASLLLGRIPISVTCQQPFRRTLDMDVLPYVHLSQSEIVGCAKFLAPFENPLIICINCDPYWMPLRGGPITKWIEIFKKLSERFTLIQFGSGTVTPIRGAVKFIDLPLRTVAACYAVVGRYVGVDTGNSHLMLAVGGTAIIVTPPDCPDHPHGEWHYQNPKAQYLTFDKMDKILEML